ncbi:MAG TPA: hypothetical protein VGM06_04370 [Polyangiaceae bacterium]
MTESRKPDIDANATVQLDALDDVSLDDPASPTVVRTPWETSRPRSRPPAASHTGSPSGRPPMIIDVPRINVEADESDAATTIFRDPLEEGDIEALKRKLRGDSAGDDDANQTLELTRLRGVNLEDLEGLLRIAPDDTNATIQHIAVDDRKLEELEASLTIEKRNRGLRKISPAVLDPDARGDGWRGDPHASSTGLRDVDAEMFVNLGKDLAAAWSALVGFARRVARGVAAMFSKMTHGGRSEPRTVAHPDDTVPPISRRARRLSRLGRR